MIAAVLLGGVSIFGGRGALHGVVAGVLLIGVLSSAMRLEGITVNIINIVIGLLLVALGDLHQRPRLGLGLRSAQAEPGAQRPSRRRRTATDTRKEGQMKFHSSAATALASPCSPRPWASTACGDDDDQRQRRQLGGGGGETTVTFLPKNLGNPYFDTSDAGGKEAVEEFGGTYDEVGPDRGHPRRPGAVHQHRRPAGRRTRWSISANDPKALCDALNEATRRRHQGRHLRLRHQPRLPRPVHQPGHRRGHRQGRRST